MFRLSTLGSVDLRAPDNRVLDGVLSQPKRVALLVYLAAARPLGFHRRDRLIALFWPELDDARARDALSQALRFLRQALAADAVLTRGVDEVGLDRERVWCDVAAFRTAIEEGRPDEALRLYGGDFLDGFFAEEASGFEEWSETERAALQELAARGARQLAEQHDAQGAHTVAVAWGRRAAELAPDDERAFRRLLGLLERAGDRAGALQAYDDFARRLRAEYGAEPAAETRVMVEAIRRAPGVPATAVATPPDEPLLSPVVQRRPPDAGSAPADPLTVGASLADGRYIIEDVLGVGGMATVYLAHDVRHERRVAVKLLRPEIAETVGTKALLREIRIAASLQHPHIVPLFDSGESAGHVFYVMPHVAGESLRARLRRESIVPSAAAMRILRDVADALAYAHRRGIIHRDIKPDNILLSGDPETGEVHALVADFGVAKAIDASRTQPGSDAKSAPTEFTPVGTPGYMAPEQAAGLRVDCRADLFAWGVVAHEILVGAHPFVRILGADSDPGAGSIEPSSPSVITWGDTPASVAALVMRCLEQDPGRRPTNGGALLAALQPETPSGGIRPESGLWRRRVVGMMLALIVPAVWFLSRDRRSPLGGDATSIVSGLDTARYVILPFIYDTTAKTPLHEVQRLHDALARWAGIRAVDHLQLNDALSRHGHPGTSLRAAQRFASELNAGRYITGSVLLLGDGLRVEATVYDTRGNRPLRTSIAHFSPNDDEASRALEALADSLLFGDGIAPTRRRESRTRIPAALQAFGRGHAFLEKWELTAADSEFSAATRHDPEYSQAYLWLAQVRVWSGQPVASWRIAAREAARYRSRLSQRDELLSDAVLALNAGDTDRACATWARLTELDPGDFATWYGLGHCLRNDSLVVRDAASPSGYRFRSSYQQAVRAYQRAFELLPSMHNALSHGSFEQTRRILATSISTSLRLGRPATPDTGLFLAMPGLYDDTLGYLPYRAAQVRGGHPGTVPASLGAAVTHQRRVFHQVATAWAAAFPQSARAVEAIAIALEMLGDASALDTLRRAKRLATTESDRTRLAAAEVLLLTKFATPTNEAGLRSAVALADSLINAQSVATTPAPRLLASIAALTGRAGIAASYNRHPAVIALERPPEPVAGDILALSVLAALGGPVDSLRTLEQRIERAFRGLGSDSAGQSARVAWLMRPATLAFPTYRFEVLPRFAGLGWPPLEAELAFLRGDTAMVARVLAEAATRRGLFAPADLTLDALYPEAWVLSATGQPKLAADRIDATLRAVAGAAPQNYADPVRAASLVRAMILRARLADRTGDRATARTWARAVTILWSRADAFLQSEVREMERLARQ